MKRTELKINKGFKVEVTKVKDKDAICEPKRSQCRTTHKRKDC